MSEDSSAQHNDFHPRAAGSSRSLRGWQRSLVLATTVIAAIMDRLDATIVTVAAPSIRSDLGGGTGTLQWYAAAYTLPFAVLLILGGRLGDLYGRRRIFLIGAVGFTLCSLLCAAAVSPWTLIAARVFQGGFGALLIPQGFGLVRAVFPADAMARAFAVFAPALGLASAAGPPVAGLLIDADVLGTGWRMVFLINIPVGLFVISAAVRWFPQDDQLHSSRRLDYVGVSLLSAAAAALIYPLVEGRAAGWPWWTFTMVALGLSGFGGFAFYERRTRGEPVIMPSLLRNRVYLAGVAVAACFFGATSGLLLVIGLWLQITLHFSPLHAGLSALPVPIGITCAAAVSSSLLGRVGARRMLQTGLSMAAAGMVLLAVTVLVDATVTSWQLVPALLTTGAGMGIVFGPLFGTALAAVDDAEVGSASGVLTSVQQLGGTLGVAILGTTYFSFASASAITGVTATGVIAAAATLAAAAVAGLLPRQARRRR